MWLFGNSQPLKWYRGKTATQTQRDAVEETSSMYVLQAVQFAKTIPGCDQMVKKALSTWNGIPSKLGPGYEYAALRANDVWQVTVQGRHYTFEKYALEALQSCLVSSQAASVCGSKIPQDLSDVLDLRIENGKCIRGAAFQIPPPTEPFDTAKAVADQVSTKVKFPALTDSHKALLHQTHMLHKSVSDWRCGLGSLPSGSVDKAHQDFESSAVSTTQQHFFQMKRFSGSVDPLWTQAEQCKWGRLQDKFHEAWMNAVEAGDWFLARLEDNRHQMMHECMNVKSDDFQVLMYCKDPVDKNFNIFNCPKLTCSQYLATQP